MAELILRRSDDKKYNALLTASFVLAYAILMAIPFLYDQWNRGVYESARTSGELVIQEFSATIEKAIVNECKIANNGTDCSAAELYDSFSGRKLIALDYVDQMENKIQTSTQSFLIAAAVQLISLVALVLFVTKAKESHTIRFTGFVLVFLGTLIAFHVISDLPHKNTKFYYVFGALFAVLLSVSDFFHRLDVTKDLDSAFDPKKSALATAKYNKWASVFQFSLAVLAAVVGTISFTLLGYLRTIFGESFVFNPLIGILVAMAYLSIIFYFGIVRNVLLVLGELESSIAS